MRSQERITRRSAVTRAVRAASGLAIAGMAGTALVGGCSNRTRNDGRLVVYAASPRKLAEQMIARYAQSTGVSVDLFSATTGQILAKVEAERLNPRADVLILASGLAAEWLRREQRLLDLALDETVLAGSGAARGWNDPHGTFVATGAACVGIAVRPGWTRGLDSWASMLDGGFVDDAGVPGRIVMPSPSRSGSSGDFVIQWTLQAGDRAWNLMADARRRGILEVKGANSEALGSLRMNESQAILAAADYLVCDAIARGDSMELHFPKDGAPMVTRPACILKSTRRPAAARGFVAAVLGEPMQQLVADANLLPASPAVPLSALRAEVGVPAAMPLDLDRALLEQRTILRRFQYEIERMVASS